MIEPQHRPPWAIGLGAIIPAAFGLWLAPQYWIWWIAAAIAGLFLERAGLRATEESLRTAARGREGIELQRQAEREGLMRERDQLRSILGAMSEGVVLLDADKRLQLANPSARSLLALPELSERAPSDFTLLDVNRSPLLHALAERGLSGERAAEEITLQNGRQILARTAPLSSRGMPGALLVFNDVTDLRRLEAVRRDLVANVSHELRTPLTAIRGYAETLQNGGLNDPQHAAEFVAIIHRHSERLSRLLDDLLELSRLEAGSRPLKSESVALRPIVQRSLDLVRPKANTRRVDLSIEVPEGPDLLGDSEATEQILVNLLDNAVKYTPQAGRVRLWATTKASGGTTRWHIAVTDDGIGIEKSHLARVFERFYRVDAGRSREMGGTGLGLAIVKHLTLAMGGRVGVESEPGKGSTFWVEMPTA